MADFKIIGPYIRNGFLIGLLFPLIALIFCHSFLIPEHQSFSISAIHTDFPLIWIIDSAPIVLSLISYFVGTKVNKLNNQHVNELLGKNELLEKTINEKDLAVEATNAKDEFLANMSHEIRTPMNAIVGFTELMQSTQIDNEQKEYLESIQVASRNLLSVINSILDFAKISSGEIALSKEKFHINKVFIQIQKTLKTSAEHKGLSLYFYNDPTIEQEIIGDEGRLIQILINLVSNAIKFTENGKVEVYNRLESESTDFYEIRFSVVDTGIGIAPEKVDEIFKRFKQAEKYTTRKYGGTGLGLSISKKIIEAHEGELTVKSTEGEGSEFAFTIKYPKVIAQKKSIAERIPEVNYDLKLEGIKILVIEDNRMNQILVERFLKQEGVLLKITNDGLEGVEQLESGEHFDIVLMDLQMPNMNGYEATIHIRNKMKLSIPIIAMTAHSLVGERDKCIELGMNEYISKPFVKKDLLSKLNKQIYLLRESNKNLGKEPTS